MDLTTLLPWAIFFGITCLLWALFNIFSGGDSRATERLDEIRDPRAREKKGPESKGVGGAFEKAAPKLSAVLQPKTELEQNELKVRMANAGFQNPAAPQIYLAIKFIALIIGALAGGGYGWWQYGITTQGGWTSMGLGAGLGFYIPELTLGLIKRSRQQKVFLSLPDALDLLVVCVEAGLGLDQGMRRIAEELEDSAPALCEELNICNMQLQMGRPRREVLHNFGVRTGVDDVKALVAILIQADRFGSSIAQALRVQSDSMRIKRSQLAEEKAAQTAVKMLFPLVLFIFPGIFVVLVGPAALRMMDGFL